MLSKFAKSEFLKNVAVLMSGTMIAQILSYFFIPIISRIYFPEDLAELDLFARFTAFGVAIATARYELAIPIAKSKVFAFRLFKFALRLAVIVCSIFLVFSILPMIYEGFKFDRIIYYGLIPVSIFCLSFFHLGNNWSLREKEFQKMSYAKMINSFGGNIVKVVLGIFNFGYLGLIFATVFGQIVSCYWFLKDYLSNVKQYRVKASDNPTKLLAKQQIDFPKVNLPHVLMETGRDILVAIIILELFGKTELGLYGQSFRVLRLPLVFAGAALGQVFFQRCAEMVNNGQSIFPMLLKAIRTLFFLSIVPFSLVFFFGEEIFSFVLGERWAMAGRYSEIMTIWLALNFMASPLSSLPLVLNRQKEFFILAILGTLLLLAGFYLPKIYWDSNIQEVLFYVSFGQSIFLIINILMILYFARRAK